MLDAIVLPTLLVVANVAGAGMVLPQVLRLRRGGVADGVSAAGAGVGIAMNLWWVGYALGQQLWGLLPVAGGAGLLYVAMAVLLVRLDGGGALRSVARGHTIGLIPLAATVGWGWTGAGLAIGVLYGFQFLPALANAIRSPSLQGISTATWLLAWIEAAIWLVYGIDQADRALVLGGGGGTLAATLILACIAAKARPARRAHGFSTRHPAGSAVSSPPRAAVPVSA